MNKVKRIVLKFAIPFADSAAATTLNASAGVIELDPETRTVCAQSKRGTFVLPLENVVFVELETPAPAAPSPAPSKK